MSEEDGQAGNCIELDKSHSCKLGSEVELVGQIYSKFSFLGERSIIDRSRLVEHQHHVLFLGTNRNGAVGRSLSERRCIDGSWIGKVKDLAVVEDSSTGEVGTVDEDLRDSSSLVGLVESRARAAVDVDSSSLLCIASFSEETGDGYLDSFGLTSSRANKESNICECAKFEKFRNGNRGAVIDSESSLIQIEINCASHSSHDSRVVSDGKGSLEGCALSQNKTDQSYKQQENSHF